MLRKTFLKNLILVTSKLSTGLLFLLLAFSMGISAQGQKVVTGVVTDAKTNEAVIGVSVTVVGTTTGTVTDIDGNYSIKVPGDDATLQFSFIGYATQTQGVAGISVVDVKLGEDIQKLEEVVVVGYGVMKKSDVSGSIVSLKTDELTDVKSSNVLESLQGKVAGMDITSDNGKTGGGVSMLIRGERSLNASNSPLIIVDGIEQSDRIDINPNDIESMEVLKDASSTAIYGAKGANGVVIITTKKGKAGVSKVFYHGYHGISEAYQKIPVYSAEEYLQGKIDAQRDILNWDNPASIPAPESVLSAAEKIGYANGTRTDWQDLILQQGFQEEHHIGVTGGNEKTTYSTSLNYYKEKGIVIDDNFKKFTFKINLDSKVNDRLTIGTSSSLSYRFHEGRGPNFTTATQLTPYTTPYDTAGNLLYYPDNSKPRQNVFERRQDIEEERTNHIFSTVYANINILPGLTYRTSAGVDLDNFRSGYMYPKTDPSDGNVQSGVALSYDESYTITNLLNFNKEIGIHSFNLMTGQEIKYTKNEDYGMSGKDQDFASTLWYNLSTNKDLGKLTTSSMQEQTVSSFFGRFNYVLSNKYIFNVTGRIDGASQLAVGKKWNSFPAASVAWRLSEENFLMSYRDIVSDLKLRVSYGTAGNYAVTPYSVAATLNNVPMYYQFGDPGTETTVFSYRPYVLGSNDLHWETTSQINLGLDYGFFKNRISGNLELYQSKSNDLLFEDKLPASTGYPFIITNGASTESKGIELSMQTTNIDAEGFTWKSQISFSANREKITSLGTGLDKNESKSWFVGEPLSVHYYFKKLGIWQFGDTVDMNDYRKYNRQPGDIKIQDTNKDTVVNDADRIVLGSKRPDWSGSLENTFSYKGLTLSFSIFARMGQMIQAGAYGFDPRNYDNSLAVDYWTPVNPTNDTPRKNSKQTTLPYAQTLLYKDGSFVKLRYVTLSYNLPQSLLKNTKLGKVEVYLSSKNTAILYSKLMDGLDAERGGSINWPLSRIFMAGINLEF